MSQDQLGLFDTPPTRKQVRFSFIIVGVLLAFFILTLAMPDVRLRQIDAFIPMPACSRIMRRSRAGIFA